jgi:hypothetical protein
VSRKSFGKLISHWEDRLIQNPILRVLSSMRARRVRALLMGGQACVLYGAAEFSRDTDLAILSTSENLSKLSEALNDLRADVIAVPPFDARYLRKGHAIHFRCRAPEAAGMRVDVMTKMRGVDTFAKLWRRRTTMIFEEGTKCEIMSLPDLVQAKKTQRDKDWPMVRRLVEVNYFANCERPGPEQIRFWLRELRTPELLIELAEKQGRLPISLIRKRPLLKFAKPENGQVLAGALLEEEKLEREADRQYWLPLRAELEKLRRARLLRSQE